MIRPRFSSGAKTAERVPTTTRASPWRTRHHSRARSISGRAAVQHGYRFAEARAHQPADPERQRDFGHQHDGGFPARKRRFNRAQINFRFAAAGDAVKQSLPRICPPPASARFPPSAAFVPRFRRIRGRREIGVPWIFIRRERLFPAEQPAVFFQALDHGARDAGLFDQEIHRQRSARVRVSNSRIFFSASVPAMTDSAAATPGFQATIFCVRVLRCCTTSRASQIAAADKLFGDRVPALDTAQCTRASADRRNFRSGAGACARRFRCRSIPALAARSWRCARPASVSEYSRSCRSSISGGSMARKVSPMGAR